MKKVLYMFVVLLGFTSVVTSCKKKGCTDPTAQNYSVDAQKDDGSCKAPVITNPSQPNNFQYSGDNLAGYWLLDSVLGHSPTLANLNPPLITYQPNNDAFIMELFTRDINDNKSTEISAVGSLSSIWVVNRTHGELLYTINVLTINEADGLMSNESNSIEQILYGSNQSNYRVYRLIDNNHLNVIGQNDLGEVMTEYFTRN